MNPEDHMETSNAAKVGDNGTGHGGFGDLFGVLVSAVEVATSGQVGPHDPAAPTITPDVPAVLDIPALPDSLFPDANLVAPYVPDVHPAPVAHVPVAPPLLLQVPVAPLFLSMISLLRLLPLFFRKLQLHPLFSPMVWLVLQLVTLFLPMVQFLPLFFLMFQLPNITQWW